MRAPQPEDAIQSLQQMFPSLHHATIVGALQSCRGNPDEAVGMLLDATPTSTVACPQHAPAARARTAHGKAAQKTMGWSAFTAQLHQQPAPSHATSGGRAAALADPAAFPQLSPGQPVRAQDSQVRGHAALWQDAPPEPSWAQHASETAHSGQPGSAALQRLSEIHPWADEALLQVSHPSLLS